MRLFYYCGSLLLLCISSWNYTMSHSKNCLLTCFAALKSTKQKSDASLNKSKEQYSNTSVHSSSDSVQSWVHKRRQREKRRVTFASSAQLITISSAPTRTNDLSDPSGN